MEKENSRINNLKDLFDVLQQLVMYRRDILVLYFVEKLIVLSSALLLAGILCIVGGMILMHLSSALSYLIAPYVGGLTISHLIITGVLILTGWCVFLKRERLIVRPLTRFLALLFLTK